MHGKDSVYVEQYLRGSEESLEFLVAKYLEPVTYEFFKELEII